MENILNNQKKIRFSGAGALYKNGAVESTINMVVHMERSMLMHDSLRCPKDTFPLILVNGNIIYCMDIHSDHWYAVWSINYWEIFINICFGSNVE